jgi:hypothetical protein
MSIINKIAARKEKNILRNLFGDSGSENSSDSDENNEENGKVLTEISINDKIAGEETEEKISFKSPLDDSIQVDLIQRKSLGIAFQLWPAASLLAEYFIQNPDKLLITQPSEIRVSETAHINIIELGAGLGLTGMYLAKYFAEERKQRSNGVHVCVSKVILTDLQDVMPILSENIQLNNLSDRVYCHSLDWNHLENIQEIFDRFFPASSSSSSSSASSSPLVIAADVIYWESLFLPLVTVLEELIRRRGCKVIISHIRRWKKDQKFFKLCKKKQLDVTTLLEKTVYLEHEHTKEETKQIQRVYLIQ